ncbi:helix-hairpin-helix domain-containing protein [Halobacillus litoralis]|uniref:helix-hairpin-helix domain-containing protein n=1 Tax=Halobacillus litoralis TaxID=45668 RepID=UPI0039906F01
MQIAKRYGWIVIVVTAGFFVFHTQAESDTAMVERAGQDVSVVTVDEQIDEQADMKVDVKGEVVRPGVYSIESGMRVNDVILLAGGMTDKADPTSVNLAQLLQDEMVILVSSEQAAISVQGTGQIVINQATQEEIQTLSGIGPSKAEAIVMYREENGPFQSKEDLLEVSGIGEKTLEAIEEEIRVP